MSPTADPRLEPPTDIDHLLRALDGLEVKHAVLGDSDADEWVDYEHLLDDLEARVAALARRFDGARPAVAASMLARALLPLVVTPTAMSWSLWRVLPDLSAANLRIGITEDRIVGVAMADPRLLEGGDGPGRFAEIVLDGVCAPLIDGLRRTVRLGDRHLWGNVSLAIAAPFAPLLATDRHDGRADREALLTSRSRLRGLVELLDVSLAGRPVEAVRRRTCCLLIKLPEPHAAMCGTCSLRPRDEQRERLAGYYRDLAGG